MTIESRRQSSSHRVMEPTTPSLIESLYHASASTGPMIQFVILHLSVVASTFIGSSDDECVSAYDACVLACDVWAGLDWRSFMCVV